METISSKRMDEVLAYMMGNNIADIKTLLTTNGVVNAEGFGEEDTQRAFLKAIKDSASFRTDLSNYMSALVTEKTGFVSQPGFGFVAQPGFGFVAQPGFGFVQQPQLDFLGPETTFDDDPIAPTPTTPTPAKKSGGFWDALGGLASKENLSNLFNTGLDVASDSLKNKANAASEERALELERLRLQQLQTQQQMGQSGASGGLSTGAIVGIAAGALVLVVVLVVALRKK